MKDKEKILHHYLHTALWTEELDSEFDIEDFAPSAIASAKNDINVFVEKAGKLLDLLPEYDIGQDIWMTRQGHGVGFWDRGLGEVGVKLTEICKEFKTLNVWKSELDVIYFE